MMCPLFDMNRTLPPAPHGCQLMTLSGRRIATATLPRARRTAHWLNAPKYFLQPENEARLHLGNIPCGIQDWEEPWARVTAFGVRETVRWWGTECGNLSRHSKTVTRSINWLA